MKIKSPTLWSVFAITLFLACSVSTAQVGINTTTPNGILEINSNTQGVVLPRLALTATNIMAPATNPQSGSIPSGTVVYNTNTNNVIVSGINYSVSPGIYVWITDMWIPQFERKQSALHESAIGLRSTATGSYANISGLVSRTFKANYTGNYRVEVKVNFAGGNAKVPNKGNGNSQSDGNLNIAKASGKFRLNINNGTNCIIPAHAYSTAYDRSVGATNYFAIWQEYSTTLYIPLNANQPISFTLAFAQDPASEYEGNGTGDGRGIIAYDIPCTVEITYVGD